MLWPRTQLRDQDPAYLCLPVLQLRHQVALAAQAADTDLPLPHPTGLPPGVQRAGAHHGGQARRPGGEGKV